MKGTTHLVPEFVESLPQPLKEGVLYISVEFRTCGHLCCCGCSEEVITPLSPAQWSITYDGEQISLNPSVGNWSIPCRSHYWIRKGRVIWARSYSLREIRQVQDDDRRDLEAHVNEYDGCLVRLRKSLGRWRS
ncbi:DUF6527 family protein [Kribbella sp. CA-245084]|uniref:DUF6527 family protein n=1 Tax=Kribbella sp. CA-245084 TaxID=3239940 RepID=UPI003D8C6BA2